MKTKFFLPALLGFFLIVISCKTTRILPDEPVVGNLPDRPERLYSQISLPMEIDIKTIESYINQNLPSGQIASGGERVSNTTSYNYQVYRNKPASFTAKGSELIFRIPIDIKARGAYTACVGVWCDGSCCSSCNPIGSGCLTPGLRQTEHGDASPTVIVELGIKLKINQDYSVTADTYLKGEVTGNTHLHIDLIGDLIRINIDIKDKLEKPLQEFVSKYEKEIDKKVTELVDSYDLKSEVKKFWNGVKEPVALGDFWLKIIPEKVIFENLNAQENKLRIGVGIASKLEVVDSKPDVYDNDLPNLELTQSTVGKFNIYLPANVTLDKLSSLAREEVVGKEYVKDGVKVKIEDIELKGIGLNNVGALLVKANVKGRTKFTNRFKGFLYFTAIPSINDETKEVSVSDFKIEANTNNFLINNGLPYLIDKFYYDELKDELKYSYAGEYEKFTTLINDELEEIVVENIIITGSLDDLNVPGIYLDDTIIEVLLIAKGKLNSRIKL